MAAMALISKKGNGALERPHCVLSAEGLVLYHSSKSRSRDAFRVLVPGAFEWRSGGRTIGADGSTLLENTIVRNDGSSEVTITAVVHDANMVMYRLWPYTATLVNQSGVGQCLSILEQVVTPDLESGIPVSVLMYDSGGCEQKKMEEGA
jgi:hypothetical protein